MLYNAVKSKDIKKSVELLNLGANVNTADKVMRLPVLIIIVTQILFRVDGRLYIEQLLKKISLWLICFLNTTLIRILAQMYGLILFKFELNTIFMIPQGW